MKKVLIVMKETYLRQVKSLAFLFMVLAPFLFMGISVGGGMIGATAAQSDDQGIVILTDQKALEEELLKLGGYDTSLKDSTEAKKALEAEEISGYLIVDLVAGQLEAIFYGNEEMNYTQRLQLTQFLTDYQHRINQESAQLTAEQTEALGKEFSFKEELVEGKSFEKLGQMISFMALIFFMYIILITYSSLTAQEVANEKGTKIMEVIFSSLPAPLYFYGKLLGILAVIATHIGIYGIGGFIAYKVLMSYASIFGIAETIQSVLGSLSLSILLFVIFGLFIYVVLAALCGSLVTRIEDVNKAVSPAMIMIMISFFGAMTFGQLGTDHIIMKVGSFIPFFSTFFMPIRVINGYASDLEAWLSLAILIVTSFGLVYVIGKSYAGLILQTDDLGLWKSFKKGIMSR